MALSLRASGLSPVYCRAPQRAGREVLLRTPRLFAAILSHPSTSVSGWRALLGSVTGTPQEETLSLPFVRGVLASHVILPLITQLPPREVLAETFLKVSISVSTPHC